MNGIAELETLTKEYGGEYGLNHSKRIQQIISIIGKDLSYDSEIIEYAAYLHDWGGYKPWKQEGIDHAVRSTIVAKEYLQSVPLDKIKKELILECIQNHHNGKQEKSLEAKLFSDADGLDFLGTIGVLRDFATKDRDLRTSIMASKNRMQNIPPLLFFETSKAMAKIRVEKMMNIYNSFEEESFGMY